MTQMTDPLYSAARATDQSGGRGWDFRSSDFHEPINWRVTAPLVVALGLAFAGVLVMAVLG